MMTGIIATKINQSQRFTPEGIRIPVTTFKTGPLVVVELKAEDKDGYAAVKLGFGSRRPITVKKPVMGTLKKSGLDTKPPRFLKEIRVQASDVSEIKPGMSIKAGDVFKPGDMVQVVGISKGKGFQGGVKRHNFRGGPRTHGQSDRERAPGSIGQTTTPGRVYRGKRMAGRMGNDRVTVKNLKIIELNDEKQELVLSGLVPGWRNSLLTIEKIG